MRAFTTSSKLQKAIMLYIISCFDLKEEKEELLKTFKALDLDNDGQLSHEELMVGYTKTMGEDDAKKEVERIMDTVDVNQTGNIDFTEFLLATVDHKKLCDKDKLGKVFKIIDSDSSGSISRREIKEFFSMGDTKDDRFAMELIEEIDKNNDGEIDEAEFYQMMGNVMEKL
jgi:Ca2+-binding EF-hand superfamily protein